MPSMPHGFALAIAQQPTSVAGNWQITAKSGVFGIMATVTGLINQPGGSLSGQLAISGSPCATSASMAGIVSGTALNIQLNESGQTVALSGTASADGNSASGTYTYTVIAERGQAADLRLRRRILLATGVPTSLCRSRM